MFLVVCRIEVFSDLSTKYLVSSYLVLGYTKIVRQGFCFVVQLVCGGGWGWKDSPINKYSNHVTSTEIEVL